MRQHLSVFALFTRSNLYRILSLFALSAAVQFIVFYLALLPSGGMTAFELTTVLQNSRISLVFAATFLFVTTQLCLTGCEYGSKPGYILRRLSLSGRTLYLWQSLSNACFYLLLWMFEIAVVLGLCTLYSRFADPAMVSPQSTYLAFYRSNFLHSVLPLDEKSVYLRNVVMTLCLGASSAAFSRQQRRRRAPIGIFLIAATILAFFVRELGSSAADYVLSLFLLMCTGVIFHNALTGGDGSET